MAALATLPRPIPRNGSGPTALVLVLVVGVRAVVGGVAEFAFGVVLLSRPGVGAVTLALLLGLFALCYGIAQIAGGIQLRSTGQDVRTILGHAT
jgi:uncharacterized membrane protein HdeD (DUF308 family)